MQPSPSARDLFHESSQQIVDYLNEHTPFEEWSVSRIAGGQQVHLHVHGGDFLDVGTRVPADETFCVRMLAGAPSLVRDSLQSVYADLPIAEDVRAYTGYAITDGDGSTFGTLCGINPTPLSDDAEVDQELLRLLSELLSTQLAMARSVDADRQAATLADAIANSDALTGLMNRRGWDLVVDDAEHRVATFGDLVGVVVIDLDGLKAVNDRQGHAAGDVLIRDAADALRGVARHGDRIARYGGDEFTVLVDDTAPADLDAIAQRYRDALERAGVLASVGAAPAIVEAEGSALSRAFSTADASMYADKRARRSA